MSLFFQLKNGLFRKIAALVAGGAIASPATAFTVYTFTGNSGTAWNNTGNWSPSGYPSSDEDDAIIPAGLTVLVEDTSIVGSIEVQEDSGDRGVIVIRVPDGELRLGNDRNVDSIVNGYVVFDDCSPIGEDCPEYSCPATIRLMFDEVTISSDTGKNGEIRGHANWYDANHPGQAGGYIYTKDSEPYILHLEGSVRLVGHLGVYCGLDNNATVMVDDPRAVGGDDECGQAYVEALCFKDHMVLGTPDGGDPEEFDKTGTGDWVCTGGTMTFENCDIDTSGNWLISNPCEDVTGIEHTLLEFMDSANVECLSGDFTVYGGRTKINTDLQTSGKLTFYSPANAVQPEIIVADEKTAVFSKTCP